MQLKRAAVMLLAVTAASLSFEGVLRQWWPQVVSGRVPVTADPALGRVYVPNSSGTYRTPQRSIRIEINENGFRDRSSHAAGKLPGVFRILVVGDSFTFGTGNQYDEIWPVLFEADLARKGYPVEVIKAGVEQFDTRSEFLLMRTLVPRYQPDLVLMGFLPNDIFTNAPLTSPPLPEPKVQVQTDQDRISMPNLQVLAFFTRLLLRNDYVYARVYWMTGRKQYFTDSQTPLAARQYEVTRELLGQAAQYAASQNSRFAVVSIPQSFQVLAKAHEFHLNGLSVDIVDRRMSEFAARQNFSWLSSLDTLARHYRERRQDIHIREDGHLTPLGNRILSDWLTDQFVRLYGPNLTKGSGMVPNLERPVGESPTAN